MRQAVRYCTNIWPIKFFRLRLLTLDNDSIVDMLDRYSKESKALKDNILRMCWYMRGGLTYDEAMMLSQEEREIISKIIKENLETTKKTGVAFFWFI